MRKIYQLLRSPHIQIALATGICIIILAYVSKRLLPEPIGYLPLAIPPFIAMLYESLSGKYKESKFLKPVYGILVIFASTALVVLFHVPF